MVTSGRMPVRDSLVVSASCTRTGFGGTKSWPPDPLVGASAEPTVNDRRGFADCGYFELARHLNCAPCVGVTKGTPCTHYDTYTCACDLIACINGDPKHLSWSYFIDGNGNGIINKNLLFGSTLAVWVYAWIAIPIAIAIPIPISGNCGLERCL